MGAMSSVKGQTGEWQVVIGLEVHAQIMSCTKLFSHAPNIFGASPNAAVDLLDGGMPGSLPVINRHCVDQAIKTGLSLDATINAYSRFDRKNYFYPDNPNGYQISQFYHPIVSGGKICIDLDNGATKDILIHHIHLENDAGKSNHDIDPHKTLVDLNRSGIGLMEIVTEPDMRSADEAALFLKKLRTILRYIDACDGNMEEGSLRADANVSICRPGATFGTRCEIKNLNSMRFLKQAVDYEVQRQIALIESGGTVVQETRLFNTKTGETHPMRSKENAHDYRYFPEPDLPPVIVTNERVETMRKSLPELPDAKIKRFMEVLGLTAYDADVLCQDRETAAYFEVALSSGASPKLIANWIISELFSVLNKEGLTITQSKITADHLAALVKLIDEDIISGKIAKTVFTHMWDSSKDPKVIVEEQDLKQISDPAVITAAIKQILSDNTDKVVQYKAGKEQLFGFFVGNVLKRFNGKANPELVNNLLHELLK
jgi:aspartyl-tRNA(Asn)/glutamyl-tRNA(Gln) amidotransferase subunit B